MVVGVMVGGWSAAGEMTVEVAEVGVVVEGTDDAAARCFSAALIASSCRISTSPVFPPAPALLLPLLLLPGIVIRAVSLGRRVFLAKPTHSQKQSAHLHFTSKSPKLFTPQQLNSVVERAELCG
jgi:hypothetical protein